MTTRTRRHGHLSLGDVGRVLALDAAGVRALLRAQDLPTRRIGGRVVVTRTDFGEWARRVALRAVTARRRQ